MLNAPTLDGELMIWRHQTGGVPLGQWMVQLGCPEKWEGMRCFWYRRTKLGCHSIALAARTIVSPDISRPRLNLAFCPLLPPVPQGYQVADFMAGKCSRDWRPLYILEGGVHLWGRMLSLTSVSLSLDLKALIVTFLRIIWKKDSSRCSCAQASLTTAGPFVFYTTDITEVMSNFAATYTICN